ncbi:MAG: ABC transporter substrate-binding protein [Candidatus Omnitrophica bacterium]|nr:ABC transporter substrate-binding protein [Candidatus Omnitrophota bacterium]
MVSPELKAGFFAFFLLIFPLIVFSQTGKQSSEIQIPKEGKYGGQLVLAVTSSPKSFNPILAKETSTTAITGLIFEGLTKTDGVTLEVKPNLATSWEVSEDGLVWTFNLRKDVRWSDGKPFTSDDVVFTFNQLICNPDIPSSARDIFTIEGKTPKVEKIDKFTVKFILSCKFAPFLRSMSQEILPRHVLEEVVSKGKFNYHWGLDAKPNDIIGTGPFKLDSLLSGERVVLVKNPYYWRKDDLGNSLPYLSKIIYIIVQNQDIALLKFQEGEIDYFGMRGQDFPFLKPKEKESNFTVYNTGPAFGTNFLVFNQNRDKNPQTNKFYVNPVKLKWFTNVEFRKAVASAIDKESIINIVMNGLGSVQNSSMSPSAGFFYNPNVVKYKYDINKAKEILKLIGIYDRNGDGKAEDSQGNIIEFNLFTNADNTERVKIANIVRKDLERLGFKVNFIPLAFNQLVSKLDSTYDWDAVMIGLTGGIEPHFGNNVWQSSGHLHMWYPSQLVAATDWEEDIDRIFNQGVQELEKKKRKAIYDRWQEIVAQKLPFIYTALPASIFAVRNKFGNLNPTSYGGAFHNLEEIYIRE